MKYLKLFESPDNLRFNDSKLDEWTKGARPFSYWFNKKGDMIDGYVAPEEGNHMEWYQIADRWYKYENDKDIYSYFGRAWLEQKVMSFWRYPTPEEFVLILWDLSGHFDQSMYNTGWQIEVRISPEGGYYTDKRYRGRDGSKFAKSFLRTIPVEEYVGSANFSEEEYLNHLNKGGLKVPDGWGSKATKDSEKGAWNYAMKKENKLFESPNGLEGYSTSIIKSSIAFFWYQGKYYQGHNTAHGTVLEDTFPNTNSFEVRDLVDYAGRIFTNSKLISFWDYPDSNEKLKELITVIEENNEGLKIWNNGWKINIVRQNGTNKVLTGYYWNIGRNFDVDLPYYEDVVPVEEYLIEDDSEFIFKKKKFPYLKKPKSLKYKQLAMILAF
jgi:hypothetical protein